MAWCIAVGGICLIGKDRMGGNGSLLYLLDTRGMREVVDVGEVLKERLW